MFLVFLGSFVAFVTSGSIGSVAALCRLESFDRGLFVAVIFVFFELLEDVITLIIGILIVVVNS